MPIATEPFLSADLESLHAQAPRSEERRAIEIACRKKILVQRQPTTIVIKPGGISIFAALVELWERRELILNLASRDLTTRYRQTLLGATWAVVQPLGLMVVLTIFLSPLKLSTPGHCPRAIFIYTALILWQYFSASISRASDSVLGVGGLLKKVYFPRLVAPIASVIPAAVDFAITFALLICMLVVSHVPLTARILLAPLFVMLAAFSALGVGFWASALHVRYRDIFHLVPFLLQLMFFASPIAYSLSSIPLAARPIYQLNPMVGAIEGFRWCMLASDQAVGEPVIFSICVGLLLLVSGLFFFRSAERSFADYV